MDQISKAHVIWHVRSRIDELLVDETGIPPDEVAIYTLSDPRDVRQARYVGQTSDPRRRYMQHVSQAKLWLPDELAWWIKSPKLRPLYNWIKELYRDERRLPVMMVVGWTDKYDALRAERCHIHSCLGAQLPLLNRESEIITRPPIRIRNRRTALV